jgi:hypothetical protein
VRIKVTELGCSGRRGGTSRVVLFCFVWELGVESPEARRKELPKAATRKSAPAASCTLLICF